MKKCKHMTGNFVELILATHTRTIENGVLDKGSFNNEYDGGLGHEYHCSECGKEWKWKLKPASKWLNDLFIKAYKNT